MSWIWKSIALVVGIAIGLAIWRLLGPEVSLAAGVASAAGWLLGRKTARPTRELAQARLDAAAELGEKRIEEAERMAKEHVEDGMAKHGSLADFVNDRTGN